MTFNSTDLLPKLPRIPMRQATFRLPLTPFFNDATKLGDTRTRGFHGRPFYQQFKSTNDHWYSDEANQPICGYEAFRTGRSVGVKRTWYPLEREEWDITITRSFFFKEDTNQVQIVNTVIPEGENKNPFFYTSHSRTPSTGKQGDPETDQDSTSAPPYVLSTSHATITFSDPVDKDWLTGELTRWIGMPEAFVQATGSGLGTYSFIGQGATKSESDGWLAIVGGGRCHARGPWFSGTPFGMVGNEGEKWNGNFSTFVSRVSRKNAPCLYQESGIRSDGIVIGPQYDPLAVGRSIYRQGHSEMQLSEPVGHLWEDDFGVFEDSTILEGFPMSPVHASSFATLLYYRGEGEANELTMVSRTGRRYRVTLQAGYSNYEYDEDDWEAEPIVTWVTVESFILTTDDTLMASASIGELENAWDIRVARIEEETTINGQLQWKLVADVDEYQQYLEDLQDWQVAWNAWNQSGREGDAPVKPPVMRNPQQLIGPSVTGKFLLLATLRLRRGSRFGFYPLVYSQSTINDRYRKKTFKMHLTPGSVEPYGGECGLDSLSGNVDYEWSEEYDTQSGLLLPREIQQWNASINGVDWTQETPLDFELTSFPGSAWTEQSATKQRREGTHTWVGKFLVGFDAPDTRGRVVSMGWTSAGMNASGGVNRTSEIGLNPPSSGHSLFFEGHRLTYTSE